MNAAGDTHVCALSKAIGDVLGAENEAVYLEIKVKPAMRKMKPSD